jgi:hypothetical protein
VSESSPSPRLYRIEAARVVDRELDALEARASAAGFTTEFNQALDRIYEILLVYPQYGDVLRELIQSGESVYTARGFTIPPLYVAYLVDEVNRRVYITAPLKALPRSGFA